MKALKSLLIVLAIIVVVYFFVPVETRTGYTNYYLGQFSEFQKDKAGAAEKYAIASEAMPDNAKFARAEARAYNDIAEESEKEAFYDKAFKKADDWLEKHKNDSDAWMLYVELARARWGKGEKNAAKDAINKAVDGNPTDYEALVYQGIIFRDMRPTDRNEVSAAINILNQAVKVRNHTRTYWAHYEMAIAYKYIKDEGKALNQIEQCLSQFPPRDIKIKAERLKNEIESGGRSEK